jgi:hypothetical protein
MHVFQGRNQNSEDQKIWEALFSTRVHQKLIGGADHPLFKHFVFSSMNHPHFGYPLNPSGRRDLTGFASMSFGPYQEGLTILRYNSKVTRATAWGLNRA